MIIIRYERPANSSLPMMTTITEGEREGDAIEYIALPEGVDECAILYGSTYKPGWNGDKNVCDIRQRDDQTWVVFENNYGREGVLLGVAPEEDPMVVVLHDHKEA